MPIIFYIKEKNKFAKQLSILKGNANGINQEIRSVVAERQDENSQMEGQTTESPLGVLWMYCM
jgi:hypothetical protein